MIEDVTCVRFLEISQKNTVTSGKDYIYVSPGTGCDSYIGRIGGKQDIHLLKNVFIFCKDFFTRNNFDNCEIL